MNKYQTPKRHTRWTPFTHNTHARTGVDTGNSTEANAAPHHSETVEAAARTQPVPDAAGPRARITSNLSGSTPPTGTSTGTATQAVAQTPTMGTSTGEAQNSLAAAPNSSAMTLRPRQLFQNCQPLRLPQPAIRCFPVSHKRQKNDEDALFSGRPKTEGKRTYGKLDLKPADFEIQ